MKEKFYDHSSRMIQLQYQENDNWISVPGWISVSEYEMRQALLVASQSQAIAHQLGFASPPPFRLVVALLHWGNWFLPTRTVLCRS